MTVPENPSQSLSEAVERIGLELPPQSLSQLEKYARLLWQKNETMNLTRHTDWDTFASRDVLDSVQVSGLISGGEVLDIGSGGGVPGLLLAILRPDIHVTCVDSVGKKTLALQEFANALDLDTHIYQCRAEELLEDFRFDFSTARAVGPLTKLCQWLAGHWVNVGHLLAIKGPRYADEMADAKSRGLLKKLDVVIAKKYAMPNTENESIILDICLTSHRKS